MKPSDFWRRVSTVEFQNEINRLFWIDEFQIGELRDLGWSCREHAWAVCLLARTVGIPACIMNGSLTHVVPNGSARLINRVGTHSWVAVEGQGLFDFSEKPTLRAPVSDTALPVPKIAYTKAIPPSWGSVIMARGQPHADRAVYEATNGKHSVGIYLGRTVDTPLPDIIENACGYINSPLTDRLKSSFSDDIYAKGLLHLSGVFFGRWSCSGSALSTEELWRKVDSEFTGAVPTALRLVKLFQPNAV
jgi:hypothetical protein